VGSNNARWEQATQNRSEQYKAGARKQQCKARIIKQQQHGNQQCKVETTKQHEVGGRSTRWE
jgi:hypothetical protein